LITGVASRGPMFWKMSKVLPFKPNYRHELLRRIPKKTKGAEIGVWKGQFSENIIENVDPEYLYLVDPWVFQPSTPNRRYGGKFAKKQQDMDNIFHEVCKKFSHYNSVRICRKTSHEFFDELSDKLDWVYIDGDHRRDAVWFDLNQSWSHTVRDGLITGDDYFWRDDEGSLAVKSAVDEFISFKNCRMEVIGGQYLIYKR